MGGEAVMHVVHGRTKVGGHPVIQGPQWQTTEAI